MTPLLSPVGLANLLGLAPRTVYNRISTGGDLPPIIRLGRLPRFAPADVEHWLEDKRPIPARTAPRRPGRPTKAEQVARRGRKQYEAAGH